MHTLEWWTPAPIGQDAKTVLAHIEGVDRMGLRRWFVDVLARGAPVETNPDSMVEVDVVPLAEGPMYVSGLEREGIDAVGIESYDVVTGTRTRVRIMVRQSDIAAAREVLEQLR